MSRMIPREAEESAELFGQLVPGSVIFISAGAGSPPAKCREREIIWFVHKYSALTVNGRRLACIDGTKIDLTGTTVKLRWYQVSPRARATLLYAELKSRIEPWLDELRLKWWWFTYRLGKKLGTYRFATKISSEH